MIKEGNIDITPIELFRKWFITPLKEYLDSAPGSIVLLVPSVKDILSDHAVYPQPPFPRELCDDDPVSRLILHDMVSPHILFFAAHTYASEPMQILH